MVLRMKTYRELKEFLNSLNEEQLSADVSVIIVPTYRCENPKDMDDYETYGEFFEMQNFGIAKESSILDNGHPYLVTCT